MTRLSLDYQLLDTYRSTMTSAVNRAMLHLTRRAESNDIEELVDTFVSAGPTITQIASLNHQILYGRRGTGKTHVLQYLTNEQVDVGNMAVYVDLRIIGSNNSIYADASLPLAERGTRLLCDVLGYIHNALSDQVLTESYSGSDHDYRKAIRMLDFFAESITDVRILGEENRTEMQVEERSERNESGLGIRISSSPALSATIGDADERTRRTETTRSVSGLARHYLHFGNITHALSELITGLPGSLWLILDEWSVVPLDLQPYLADLLRRSVMPVKGIAVKIGAIEKRTNFKIGDGVGGYIGFELGSDISADMDLDDFMVFGNDSTKAENFFQELLYRHVLSQLDEADRLTMSTSQEFISKAFTGREAFTQFVRAAEGVPRDAMQIAALAAGDADDDRISVPAVRKAAKKWYLNDKQNSVQSNREANALLLWVVDEVISGRKTRGFLLRQDASSQNELISSLYDSRVIHIIKRGIAAKDQPGVRFDVYSLDYGCYVDLISTSTAPRGLFEVEDEAGNAEFVEVPMDDYRSLRRAVLDLADFEAR